jgi:hypothetical protein
MNLNAGQMPELRPVANLVNPLRKVYLARVKETGAFGHVVAIHFIKRELLLCDPVTQAPPGIMVPFDAVEIVAIQDVETAPDGSGLN